MESTLSHVLCGVQRPAFGVPPCVLNGAANRCRSVRGLGRTAGLDKSSRGRIIASAAENAEESGPTGVSPSQGKPSGVERLISVDQEMKKGEDKAFTVYSLRVRTGIGRGSSLSDINAGVWVCLVGQNGTGFLHRISPIFDSDDSENELRKICQIADVRAGANCPLALQSSNLRKSSSSSAQPWSRRFDAGSVDEVSFLGPELGPLAKLIVGPEQGSWYLDEVTVSSSRTKHTDRFVCRTKLGERQEKGAVMLTPVAPEAVVYGSGDSAVALSKKQARELRQASLYEYGEFKAKLLLTTAGLVAGGGAFAAVVGGPDAALPFALGGSCGFLYQWMLQRSVDAVPTPETAQVNSLGVLANKVMRTSTEDSMQRIMGSPFFRYAVLGAVGLFSFWALQYLEPVESLTDDAAVAHYTSMQHLLTAILGFFMYKLAVVGVAMSPIQNDTMSFQHRR